MPTGIREVHRDVFGELPGPIARAPGRVGLIGFASVPHEGLALTATVDRYVTVSLSRRHDGRIQIRRGKRGPAASFGLHEIKASGDSRLEERWRGLLRTLQRKRVHFNGFNAIVESSIPSGLGLGEWAAMDTALALALRRMFPFSLTHLGAGLAPRRDARGGIPPLNGEEKRLLAAWCQEAKGQGEVWPMRNLDPTPILMGRAWHAMAVDCRFQTVEHYPLIGCALVFCDSGQRFRWEGDSLAEGWSTVGRAAAAALQTRSLRSVDLAYLKANGSRLKGDEYAAAYHVVGEIQRVVSAEKALRDEDFRQVGHWMSLSGDCGDRHLGADCPDAKTLLKLARELPGCLGARTTDPLQGEAMVALVSYHQVEDFVAALRRVFRKRTGREISPLVFQLTDGAS